MKAPLPGGSRRPAIRCEKDEPLFEISTDKVDAEIPSPVAGVLSEIKVAEGATVQVNTVVAVVSESGETIGDFPEPSCRRWVHRGSHFRKARSRDSDVQAAGSVPTAPVAGGTDVVMPQMGESIFEGTITKWLKKAGDQVQKDEPLFEISTDKVDAEIPSPVAGELTEIKVPEGATVQINTVVAVIGGAAAAQAEAQMRLEPGAVSSPVAESASDATPTPVEAESAPASSQQGLRIRSSPLVRRIAKDNNLDLSRIPGTGSEGRITKDDVLRHLAANGPGGASAVSAAPAAQPNLLLRLRRHGPPNPNSSRRRPPPPFPGNWFLSARCGPSLPSGWLRAYRSAPTCTPSTRWT